MPLPRLAPAILLSAATVLPAMTEDQSKEVFPALQAAASRMPLLAAADGDRRFATVQLNLKPVTAAGARVDAVRLAVPATGGDLVWSFAIPRSCSSWYIIPAAGSGPGFSDFARGRHYRESTWPSDQSYRPFLQTLAAEQLVPGREYLIWFEFTSDAPAEIHAAVRFAKPPAKGWDDAAIEQTLGLTPADAEQRAERFATRGAALLRNAKLVDQPFGGFRLLSLVHLLDGMPIAITTAPGRLPSIAAARAAVGKPDLVLEHDPLLAAGLTRFGTGDPVQGTAVELQPGQRTAWFDHVALTAADEQSPATGISVHAWNAAVSAARHGGDALDHLPEGWTLLHRDGRLQAVLRDMGGKTGAVAHGTVPAGIWLGRREGGWIDEEVRIDAQGDGTRTLFSHPSMRSEAFALRAWRYEGEAVAYYDPARKRAVVHYRAGQLDGEAVWYELDGSVSAKANYRQGKRLPAAAR